MINTQKYLLYTFLIISFGDNFVTEFFYAFAGIVIILYLKQNFLICIQFNKNMHNYLKCVSLYDIIKIKKKEIGGLYMRYGIFKADSEFEKIPKESSDIIDSDEYIGKPEMVFDNLEEALDSLYTDEKYGFTIHEYKYVHTVYNCRVYFVAEIEIYDEEEDINDPDNMVYGGIDAIRGLYRDEYDEEYRPESPKISSVKFTVIGDNNVYNGVKIQFPPKPIPPKPNNEWGCDYAEETYYVEDATTDEIENLCKFACSYMNYHEIEKHFDLLDEWDCNENL